MSYQTERNAAGRHLYPDLVRSFALIGIALVNVSILAYPIDAGYFDGGIQSTLDQYASWVVDGLFIMKSYTLFSFMFGVGFAYQMRSADKAGARFVSRYFRRITGLLVLGFLHISLAFTGDILVIYGLLGGFLFLFRNSEVKTLLGIGAVFIGLQILIAIGMAALVHVGFLYAPGEMAAENQKMLISVAQSREIFMQGAFWPTVQQRLNEYQEAVWFLLIFQGAGVFGFFLMGLAAVKSGLITDPDHTLWRRFRRFALPIGLIGSGVGAWILTSGDEMFSPQVMWGMALLSIFAPLSTAGYLGLIAKWAAAGESKFRTFMARGGTATLTAYLMQSLLFSWIFNGHGLGLYGKLGAASCIGIALAVALFTLWFSSMWRTKFARGPMEALLRRWTYWGPK
jgi:uncharacterized protein